MNVTVPSEMTPWKPPPHVDTVTEEACVPGHASVLLSFAVKCDTVSVNGLCLGGLQHVPRVVAVVLLPPKRLCVRVCVCVYMCVCAFHLLECA